MGISLSSSNRRRNNHYPPNPPPPYYYPHDAPPTRPYSHPMEPPYPLPQNPYHTPPLPPPPPPPPLSPTSPVASYLYGPYGSGNYGNPSAARFNFHYHYHHPQPYYAASHQPGGWGPMRPPMVVPPPAQPPPPYVEHQNAKKVRNDVNVHKDTVKLEVDENNPDKVLVSFVFDALFDGSFTIFYFAKEESNCRFTPRNPEVFVPLRIPFQKGVGQKFRQPSGTGIDLGFFSLDDLSKPSEDDVFPLVISAETNSPVQPPDGNPNEPEMSESVHMQISQAILEKDNVGIFRVKVVRQILWIEGVRYELRELYGIGSSVASAESFDDSEPGKECVICMSEPKDTAVLPCRHMCMCSECAKALRLQSNKCPICRQPIDELIEIKINDNNQ